MSQTPTFRTVLRGYDPAEVDKRHNELSSALVGARQEAADRTIEASQLQQANGRLREELAAQAERLSALEDEHRRAAAPTYADLGERIGTILALADEEAEEMRRAATAEAETLRGTATIEANETRTAADRYAEEVRTKADAEAKLVVEKARREADAILDDADREASARREEGEAFYESQRARAAAAAADFESTLGQRRETAAQEFAAQMAQQEQALSDAQQRAQSLSAESEQALRQARAEAKALVTAAREEAEGYVVAAREQAERIRRDSERELAAATARRDSITAQLSNVRQMLSTLGGASMAESLVGEVPAEPSAPGDEPQAEVPAPGDEAQAEVPASADEAQGADEPKKGEEQQQKGKATAQKQGVGARR
ncbi:hypothetical protein [Knoellia sp. p5-6-4]|uniref:hypothetical protein n=1 Tax=unclassified Knoellia TaxID=2618719 RepID=UPI0023DBC6DA|nr:hypothetical protein [Knoellia sp. p5-6-4]MDF2145648.1 hypothetical protein [Knoellia sp. p5-6-4]